MVKNHFTVLGLSPGVSEDEIKRSFRKLALKWHPDKNKDAGAEDKFKEISAAYKYLQSKDRRDLLERDLTRKQETRTSETHASSSSYFNTSSASRKTPSESYTSSSQTHSAKKEGKSSGAKKDRNRHWSKSFLGKNQKRTQDQKPWSEEWDGAPQHSEEGHAPKFSSAFRSFVDHLGAEFDSFFTESSFGTSQYGSAFTETEIDPSQFLYQATLLNRIYTKKEKPPARARHVAPERGAEEINKEYLFSPRQGQGNVSDDSDMSSDGEFGYDADRAAVKLPCHYCGKLYRQYRLVQHEERCGKFGDSSDEDQNVFNDNWSRPAKPTGDWRQAHADLLTNIRRAKQSAKANVHSSTACQSCGSRLHQQNVCPLNQPSHRSKGQSKSATAKEYARKVPRPGHQAQQSRRQSRPDTGTSSEEEEATANRYQAYKHMKQDSRTGDTSNHGYAPPTHSAKQRLKRNSGTKSDFLGVNGEGFGSNYSRHGSGGCSSCRRKFGSSAKFACSCGTKTSF